VSKDKRIDWTVLGRKIGTATGWDQADTFVMMLYDFEPLPCFDLPSGGVNIDFERGTIETYDDNGNVTRGCDLVNALFGSAPAKVAA
jgi:hypothetical protein